RALASTPPPPRSMTCARTARRTVGRRASGSREYFAVVLRSHGCMGRGLPHAPAAHIPDSASRLANFRRRPDDPRPMAGALQGRVALVTGASRGIGAAIAERFAAEGASVAVTARSLDAHPDHLPGTLFEVADRIRKRGVRAATIGADLTEPSERPRI